MCHVSIAIGFWASYRASSAPRFCGYASQKVKIQMCCKPTPPTCPWSQQADDAAALEGRNQSSAGPDYHYQTQSHQQRDREEVT